MEKPNTHSSKSTHSAKRFSVKTSPIRKSGEILGLLPTPTTGSNRNSKNAIQLRGKAHQNHGIALGLAQVLEIAGGEVPKEFDSVSQIPHSYLRAASPVNHFQRLEFGKAPMTPDISGPKCLELFPSSVQHGSSLKIDRKSTRLNSSHSQ